MNVQIKHILACLDRLAPFSLAEKWDNVGLLAGNPEAHVTSVLLGLDPSLQLLDEAIALGANTLITHHPCIFHPLAAVVTNTPGGIFLEKALTHKINIISCHTNLDNAVGGTNDALALALGLTDLSPLRPGTMEATKATGMGRIGTFDPPLSAPALLDRLFHTLQLETIQIAGRIPEQIKTMALCGGSGSELAERARAQGADLYLSAEIKHSTARWAEDCGFCVIDGTHYGTEQPIIPFLQGKMQEWAAANNWSLNIFLTQTEKHPFTCNHKNKFI